MPTTPDHPLAAPEVWQVLEGVPTPMALVGHDGRVQRANLAMAVLIGELGGEFPAICAIAEERKACWEALNAVLAGAPESCFDTRVMRPDGDVRILRLHIQAIGENGGAGVLVSGEDRTEEERSAMALDVSERELLDLKDALDHASIVAATDAAGRIISVNERFCAISGYSRDELLGKTHQIINSGHHPREFWVELWRTIGRGDVWRGEVCNRAKDGQLYWVDTTIIPFFDVRGRTRQYLAIRTEITERKQAEAQLREATALARLGTMASVVAHEVKNPLAGISGALQIVGRRLPEGTAERAVIGDILDRIDALNATMEDLLDYARPREPRTRATDLRAFADDVVGRLRDDPRFSGVTVEVRGDSAVAEADPALLDGVLLNLLINAAQALSGKGSITIDVSTRAQGCRLCVHDDGPGMPADRLARAFEPFFTTRHRGTGLGLAIVRRVVEAHEGEVRIDCPIEGGTVVTLDLPSWRA
ncbi:MAG: PAS domain S-box protein [Deltaproteobacteria bacterium]|nr:PAS domain S-box protein [Deltaproteobacteria bacterium]